MGTKTVWNNINVYTDSHNDTYTNGTNYPAHVRMELLTLKSHSSFPVDNFVSLYAKLAKTNLTGPFECDGWFAQSPSKFASPVQTFSVGSLPDRQFRINPTDLGNLPFSVPGDDLLTVFSQKSHLKKYYFSQSPRWFIYRTSFVQNYQMTSSSFFFLHYEWQNKHLSLFLLQNSKFKILQLWSNR